MLRWSHPPPSLFLRFSQERGIRQEVRAHANLFRFLAWMRVFPGLETLELCTDETKSKLFWQGKIDAVGDLEIHYSIIDGELSHSILLRDKEEHVTRELNEVLQKFPHFTPPMSLWFCRRWISKNEGSNSV